MLKHFIIAICTAVSERVFGMLSYGIIFHKEMEKYMHIYRSMNDPLWMGLLILPLITGFIFSYIYFWLKANLKNSSALILNPFVYTATAWFLTRVMGEFFNYIIFGYSFYLALAGILTTVFNTITIGFILYLVSKRVKS